MLGLQHGDESIEAAVMEATAAFSECEKREWLSWGALIMPELAEEVRKEEEEAVRVEAERAERAAEAAAEAARADAARQATAARQTAVREATALWKRKEIDDDEYRRRVTEANVRRVQEVPRVMSGSEGDRSVAMLPPVPGARKQLLRPRDAPSMGGDLLEVAKVPMKRRSSDNLWTPGPDDKVSF